MRAPDEQTEARWKRFKRAIADIGIDADQAVVTSTLDGTAATLRSELERIGQSVEALRRVNPTAKQIAGRLRRILDELDEIANLHWPRGHLYREARQKITEAAALIESEFVVLRCARGQSSRNAASSESVFRRHALRIWSELAGERGNDRRRTVTFVHAAECAFLVKTNRDAVRKWIARQADISL